VVNDEIDSAGNDADDKRSDDPSRRPSKIFDEGDPGMMGKLRLNHVIDLSGQLRVDAVHFRSQISVAVVLLLSHF